MEIQPYLHFDGRCEEAIDFYRSALGAEVTTLMRFKDAPPGMAPELAGAESSENKVMHASLRIGDTTILVSDGQCADKAKFQGFSLSLMPSSDTEAERLWSELADGGEVVMPLGPTFFTSRFGMVADRFGVPWMIVASPVAAAAR